MQKGCFTAIITPFKNGAVDYESLKNLVGFQIQNGINGILSVGTTGSSPTLSKGGHVFVAMATAKFSKGKVPIIVGTGSNNTEESIYFTKMVQYIPGVKGVLLVDPYYNGPSSLEIDREYIRPIAETFPDLEIIPYIIPGRTGAQLYPEDIAALAAELGNVNAVKEATGSIENMIKTRKKCGKDLIIFSGDDGMTLKIMSHPDIVAEGAFSVMSNIFPGPITEMVRHLNEGNFSEAEKINGALKPMFEVVTVITHEDSGYGERPLRSRNPVPVKTLMNLLGMSAGSCRRPLGRMTRNGFLKVLGAVRSVWRNNPEMLEPVANFFNVDIEKQLYFKGKIPWESDLFY